MRKFYTLLVLVCFFAVRAGAQNFKWTDAKGVIWEVQYNYFYNNDGTNVIYWCISSASGYGDIVEVPEIVYRDSDPTPITIEAFYGYDFNGCQVKLPSSIKRISGLMQSGIISIDAATPPIIEKMYDNTTQAGITILVPDANLSAYRNADGWKDIAVNIISQTVQKDYNISVTAMPSTSGIHAAIGEDNLVNVMSLKVTGSINSYDILIIRNKMHNLHFLDLSEADIVANAYKYYENYSTTDNVLGYYAFTELTKLITVKLPNTLKIIDRYAFQNCRGLKTVDFPNTLKRIRDHAFYECQNLREALLKEGVDSIGYEAFRNCRKLEKVELKTGLKSIGSYAFANCDSLRAIDIPKGITRIENSTFEECRKLKSVSFPSTLTEIGSWAFRWCYSLTTMILPTKLERIGYGAFNDCSSLAEVRIPSSIRSIENAAFGNCQSLKDYYVYTLQPTKIEESTFSNWTSSTLHTPRLAYYNYYWDTQWSKFDKLVTDNEYEYDYFYLTQDFIFTDNSGTLESTPDVQLDGGSGLVVETTNPVNLNEVHMADNGDVVASIIANGNLKAEKLYIDVIVQPGRWRFISFPFRVKVTNISAPGQYVIRYYDGATRAANGFGGWKNYTGEYLLPKQGYILQCKTEGILTLTVEKEDLDFSGGDRQDALASYTSTNKNNASWNFLGNPHSSYFDIDETGYEAPITVWNGTSYQAVRAGDDQYHLSPMQGFFVQKAENVSEIGFPAKGRHTLNQWAEIVNAKNTANSRAAALSHRQLINLTISDGENVADQTRVVFNPQKSQTYEMDCDAAKFMSDLPVAQLYSIDEQTNFAINERPLGEVCLGYVAPSNGTLTICATRMDTPVMLRDNEKGITHDLSLGGYTFSTEAGTFENRFTLIANTTGISTIAKPTTEKSTIYSLDGTQLSEGSKPNGAYIVKKGNKAMKVINK